MTETTTSEIAPKTVATLLDNPTTLLFARFCLALPFLVGGLAKLLYWSDGVAEMERVGLAPAWAFNLAALATQLVGSALVILDRKTWLGAGALGVFTVVATFLDHRFWELNSAARMAQMNAFLEHAAIGAGFILVSVVSLRRER
jgi:transmembrane protein